ncbi:hypothetical protein [Xylanimonas protaetiae]|uniref:Uncharacterized protein n=1 Tax=Xylanimonas protaetiae TaxID=2509457 RepID=A0A4P6F5Q1_9MICO|nr:hypothetical protein [Xylanimonas protaetiae]QAY70716.1 hypothetical protein ET471_12380 [Xylanimonas protaetiae]
MTTPDPGDSLPGRDADGGNTSAVIAVDRAGSDLSPGNGDELGQSSADSTATPAPRTKLIWSGVLCALALVSAFVIAPIATNPAITAGVRERLSDQQTSVTAMASAAAGLSVATDLIPNVDGIPAQLADLSGWFIVIIAAIILQKVLIGVVGYVSFAWVIPAACLIGIAFVITRREILRALAIKLAIFAIVLFVAMPAAIAVSDLATNTFNDSQAAIAQADAIQDAAEEEAEAAAAAEAADQDEADTTDRGGLLGLLDDARAAASRAVDAAGDAVGEAFDSVSDAKDDAVTWLDSAIQQIALWIITTCVVPLLTIAMFAWVIKILFGFDVNAGGAARGIAAGVSRAARAGGARAKARRGRKSGSQAAS